MGIREAILQELEEKSMTIGFEKGMAIGIEKGILQTKIKGIRKFLNNEKLTLEEIAEGLEVSVDFVLKVKSGEIV